MYCFSQKVVRLRLENKILVDGLGEILPAVVFFIKLKLLCQVLISRLPVPFSARSAKGDDVLRHQIKTTSQYQSASS